MPARRSKPKPRAKKPRRVSDSLTVSVLQSTLESTADGILVVDDEGRIVSHNRRFEEMWRLSAQQIAANDSPALIAHVQDQLVDPDAFAAGVRQRYADPESDSFDILSFKDGRMLERYSLPLRMDGHVVGRVWSFRDVTARRRAECVQEAVYRISHTAHMVDNLQELLGAIHEIVGELMPAKNFYVSLYDAEHDRLEFPYFVEDAWREQSELLQRIVDNIPVMLAFLDEQGRIQWGNREWTRTLGYDIAEARERDLFAELYPDPGEQRRLRDSIGAPVGQWTDFRTRTRHGTVLDTIWANAPLTGGGWLAIGMDVSERRRAEERYRSFIAQSSEGVSRLEVDPPVPLKLPEEEQVDRVYAGARIAECNDAMARMYGFKEARDLVGTRLAELHNVNDPTNREQIRSFIRAGYRVSDSETREHDRDGRPRVFLNNVVGFVEDGHLVRVWGTQRDVTDQRHLEEQFRQSQKMEAVGQLAGGIAHDFNNLLTAILGNTQLLLRELPPGDSKRGDVEEIRKASERAASLTRQLLAYSRRQMLQPVVLDLNVVVAEMDKLLRRLIGEHIALVTVLAPGLGRVKADPNQLEQVIVNLAVNARDAMPEGGKLTIETANVDLDETFAQAHLGSVPGA